MLNKTIIGITTACVFFAVSAGKAAGQEPGNPRCYELQLEAPGFLSVPGDSIQTDTLVLKGAPVDTTAIGETGRAYLGTEAWRAAGPPGPRTWSWVRLSTNSLRIVPYAARWNTRWEARETAAGLEGEAFVQGDQESEPEKITTFTADPIPCPGRE
jgi:hypothetical protein